MQDLVKIENLSISFQTFAGNVQAVRNVSFEIAPGECTAIVGESGCGKSTAAKAIMGLHRDRVTEIAKDSRIIFENENILQYTKKEWQMFRGAKASMIFQDAMSSLNPTMRVGDQIAEAMLIHQTCSKKEAGQRTVDLLKQVGVVNPKQSAKRYPHEFSGGMRQRVMIAMAVACMPRLLIADEPTTALDVTLQTQILQLIKEQQERNKTSVLFITHDLGIVAGRAQKVIVMYGGMIVEKGTTEEVFYQTQHPYTKALLRSSLRVDEDRSVQELYSIDGMPPNLLDPPKGCPFAMRCPKAMNVCVQYPPKEYREGSTHVTYCWKYWKKDEQK